MSRDGDCSIRCMRGTSNMAASVSRVLIYGGKGALGASCVSHFKARNWWIACVDLHPNEDASANVIVDPSGTWIEQDSQVQSKVDELLGDEKLDAVICVAGGWAGGSAKSKSTVKNADLMFKQSVWTSLIATSLSSKHLKEGGMLVLTGAQPSLRGTPGMLGYGMAKAAVHQLVKGLGMKGNGLPADTSAFAILPMTLDTPMNRKGMPNADHTQWTPLEFLANLLCDWAKGIDRPDTGSLVKIITKDGNSHHEIHTGALLTGHKVHPIPVRTEIEDLQQSSKQ